MKVQESSQLVGRRVLSGRGDRIGTVVDVRCSAGDPYDATWALVRLRGLRRRLRLVPLSSATTQSFGQLVVPYDAATVARTPPAGPGSTADAGALAESARAYQLPSADGAAGR